MDIFTALADPRRREIIELLANKGKLSATDICNNFKVSPPAISQHLKVLLEVNLVKQEKRAQQRLYELDTEGLKQINIWTHKLQKLWDSRFDALDQVLEAEKKKLLKNKEADDYDK